MESTVDVAADTDTGENRHGMAGAATRHRRDSHDEVAWDQSSSSGTVSTSWCEWHEWRRRVLCWYLIHSGRDYVENIFQLWFSWRMLPVSWINKRAAWKFLQCCLSLHGRFWNARKRATAWQGQHQTCDIWWRWLWSHYLPFQVKAWKEDKGFGFLIADDGTEVCETQFFWTNSVFVAKLWMLLNWGKFVCQYSPRGFFSLEVCASKPADRWRKLTCLPSNITWRWNTPHPFFVSLPGRELELGSPVSFEAMKIVVCCLVALVGNQEDVFERE